MNKIIRKGEIVLCPSCDIELELDDEESLKLEFTCPQCGKLYDVEPLSINISQPSLIEIGKPLFTKKAITVGTVFGGPLTGGYLLSENFKSLNKNIESRVTLIASAVITILIIPLLLFIPGHVADKIPEQLFHLLWAGIVFLLVKKYQRDSINSYLDNGGKKGSGWIVFYAIIVGTLLTFAYGFAFAYLIASNEPNDVALHNLTPIKNEFTKGVLYYDSIHIKSQDSKVVSLLLSQIGYFNDQMENEATYYKENETYYIGIYVDEQYWDEAQVKHDIKMITEQLLKSYPERKYIILLTSIDSKGNRKEFKIE